ncbi:DUF2867 domain-containing protein [Rhizobium sp. L1K21]|uniref:DUF2867 domain-containing protein n=1 Tax=Rhizobium sp. L1K21 TaxID=2954933 RepID=UPI00209243C6|nr:DUF2867 domain-containing protein [Rhizobium sp. L1K21]MCO6184897.1 DUF2867 domain-containing protein [Rhizobium sp. L1K21]
MIPSYITEADYRLPSAHLAGANWADAFVVLTEKADLSAPEAAKRVFERKQPGWITALMTLRDRLGRLIGLKSAGHSEYQEKLGIFPILEARDDCVVLGFDDWHLDFRIVVETRNKGEATEVQTATLVKRKHWIGYVYIFLITPFHKMIVKRLLSNLVIAA